MNNNSKNAGKSHVWIWLILVVIIGGVVAAVLSSQPDKSKEGNNTQQQTNKPKEKTADKKWDYAENYDKVQNGMTKAEVETAIGRTSDNCAVTTADEIDLVVEACNYGTPPDNGLISVTYENGKVTTKAKAPF
jgi:uncharacterized protein HemX